MKTQLHDAPNFSLKDKVALITGASRGIGRAIALAYAAAGAKVVLGVRDIASAGPIINEIENNGGIALGVELDIAKRESIDKAVTTLINHWGRIDILVNNAGIAPGGPAEYIDEKSIDAILAVNIKGTFQMSQAAGRIMLAQNSGTIINISSQAATVTLPGESVYCMGKAAINHLTRCLAKEWAAHAIRVNSISPTFVWTDGTQAALTHPESYNHILSNIPLGRIGHTSDIVGAAIFLSSSAASMITGTNLLIDGGWSLG